MADQQKIKRRQDFAHDLLDSGVSVAHAAAAVQAKFSISRATAYRDTNTAAMTDTDDGPAMGERGPDVDSLVGMLQNKIVACLALEDYKSAVKLVDAMDKLQKQNGYRIKG